jgi:regulator of sigma E protease
MPLLIFIIILSALVFVHELGHFSVAKFFGIRVDEFGLGYPPRAKRLFSWKGTDFTLNWLPFGGFVKIFGETYAEEAGEGAEASSDSFQHKNRGIQAAVLLAGVVGNFFFAWLILSLGFVIGLPAPENLGLPVTNQETVITMVLPDSPAELSGFKTGDTILSLSREGNKIEPVTPQEASDFILESFSPIEFTLERGGEISTKVVTPTSKILEGDPAVGIAMDVVGIIKLPPHTAFYQGLKTAASLTLVTAEALGTFIREAVGGRADLSSVTGPVGLVGIVGEVTELGFGHLLTLVALISINLSLINLLPFPALDGGRLLFVGIEALTRRPIPSRIFNALNTAGFALLVFLMILVTIRDVRNIF